VGEVAVDVRGRRRRLPRAVVLELDPSALDLLVEVFHLLVLEIDGLSEVVHLGVFDAAVLLPSVEEGLDCCVHVSRISGHEATKQRTYVLY
jgi:hypothetical protein